MKVFFFGCLKNARMSTSNDRIHRDTGHYFWDTNLWSNLWRPSGIPFTEGEIDGKLLDGVKGYVNGKCHLLQDRGWTVLSFWDQTGDSRPASNSNFLIEGTHTFDQVVEIARQHFPTIFERFEPHFKLELVSFSREPLVVRR